MALHPHNSARFHVCIMAKWHTLPEVIHIKARCQAHDARYDIPGIVSTCTIMYYYSYLSYTLTVWLFLYSYDIICQFGLISLVKQIGNIGYKYL